MLFYMMFISQWCIVDSGLNAQPKKKKKLKLYLIFYSSYYENEIERFSQQICERKKKTLTTQTKISQRICEREKKKILMAQTTVSFDRAESIA